MRLNTEELKKELKKVMERKAEIENKLNFIRILNELPLDRILEEEKKHGARFLLEDGMISGLDIER